MGLEPQKFEFWGQLIWKIFRKITCNILYFTTTIRGTHLKGADSLDFGKPNLFSYVTWELLFLMKTVKNFDMMKKT